MNAICKFPVPIRDDEFTLNMPDGAVVLSVGVQREQVQLWALVDPEAKTLSRGFHIRGTGQEANGLGRLVGTFQLHGGDLVFHLFERKG